MNKPALEYVRDRDYMYDLYVVQEMSIKGIAKRLGVSSSTVHKGLSTCKIPTRPTGTPAGKPKPGMAGENHPRWRGGTKKWRETCRRRIELEFTVPVLERDGHTCQHCGSKEELEVHHRRPLHVIINAARSKVPADAPVKEVKDAIMWEHSLEDGITLCASCHKNVHASQGY